MLDLSIVIVNYRSWDKLEPCLLSLQNQSQKIKSVIVVDNYSNDGILDTFSHRFPEVDWIPNDYNAGFAAGCNLGSQKVGTKWLLFLNPDTLLQAETLGSLIPYCDRHPDFHLITIRQLSESGKNTHPYGIFPNVWNSLGLLRAMDRRFFHPDQTKKSMRQSPITFPHWISGSFVLIRKKHFEELKGWDERFWMYCEDIDLSKRAADNHLNRVLLNGWECLHSHGVSSRKDTATKIFTKAEVIKSTHRYIEKHFQGNAKKTAQQWLRFHKFLELSLLGFIDNKKWKILKLLRPFWRELFSSRPHF